MSVRTKLAKAVRISSEKSARWLHASPRIPYLHYWTLREGAQSLICLHNFFSILAPETRLPCRAFIRLYDADGRKVASTSLDLPPRGSRMLDVGVILRSVSGSANGPLEGSLELDVAPPGDFSLVAGEPGALSVSSSYFYMLYRSPRGMLTTVHAIERGPTYRGVPAPLGSLLGLRTRALAGSWRSKRAISAANLGEIRTVAINHASGPREMHLGLKRGPAGPVVAETSRRVPSLGLLVLEHLVPEPHGGDYVVFSRALATPNSKPYVWVRYGSGPMSMHHG